MEFDLFEKTFYEALKGSMEPEGTGVFQAPIYKNGVLLPGFILRRTGSGAGVTINIRDYYEKWEAGQNLDELVFDVKNEILFKKIPEFDFHDLSREKAEESIISCVVGYEKNQAWLKNFPHERIQDMAVYARWQLTDEVSFPVSDMVMSSIKMTKEEMLAVAKANHKKKASFNLLEDILFHLSGPSKAEFNGAFDLPGSNAIAPMYILGNQSGIQGAAVAMDPEVLLAVKKCLQDDFYLLPSSIHETIIIPKAQWNHDVNVLREMVCSVNGTEVPLHEQLTNSVYEFDGRSLKMAGVSEKMTIGSSMDNHRHRR